MKTGGFTSTFVLLGVFACVCAISASPIYTSTIKCDEAVGEENIGPVDENYSGDVELVNGINPAIGVKLVPYIFTSHVDLLELHYTPGETTATIRTKEPLDADVLANTDRTLYYAIMCNDPRYANPRTLKVNDLNDNPPKFQQSFYNETISEAHVVNSKVLRVEAKDNDSSPENNQITYSIEPASEDFTFINGRLSLKRPLNYNLIKEYHFVVTARDGGGLNDTASVLINVQDFDDLNPYFSHSLYQAAIKENEIGPLTSIHPEAIKAQDGDVGINMTLAYSITAVSPEHYRGNFNINSSSGVLSVETPMDREMMDSSVISVSIKATQTDNSWKTAEAVVLVTVEDVNDNSPTFDRSEYLLKLPENSPNGTIVHTIHVTDLDQGGFVGTLRISPETSPFSIDPDGTVRVANSTYLDREDADGYAFEIIATESGPSNHSVTARVEVDYIDENDNSPIFTSSHYEAKVYANQSVGMLLVKVEAKDHDKGVNGEIRYSIDFGNDDGHFSVDASTGQISLAKLIDLDINRILEFPLYVSATDRGLRPLSSSALVTIQAPGSSKPEFLQKVYSGTVQEEQDPGVVILKVDFLAIPSVTPVELRVVSHQDKFSIASNGEFSTLLKFDYDTGPHNYSVEITITDGTNNDSATVEVQVSDINDNSPVFANDSVTVAVREDAEVGSSVVSLTATDQDSSFNKEIRYSLRGGQGRFSVDPVSGVVSVAIELDRETQSEYDLLVVAEDQGQPARSANATLLIKVSDVNDNAPKFSQAEYQHEVLESLAVGTDLINLSASDPDEGVNGMVTYSILQQTPSSEVATFQLNASTGLLQLAQPLDYSKVQVYTLEVEASDGGSPPLVGKSSVVVKVKDVNNNNPEFSQESYTAAVSENLASGASLLTLEVTDKDEGGFSKGFFLHTSDTFDISEQGVVSLKNNVTLDREKTDRYDFEVVAVDQADGGLQSTAQVTITVLDYNDNAPQFPPIPDPLQIPEGIYSEEAPREIFAIVATDADLGANGNVTVSLSSPHPLFRFREDGMLLAVGSLDRETRETYELLVKATDGGSPQMENIMFIRVSLIDVNDNTPKFSQAEYQHEVLESLAVGTDLINLSASDPDEGVNGMVTYSILQQTPSSEVATFQLNASTGLLQLAQPLDYSKVQVYTLEVEASDGGSPALVGKSSVVVKVKDVNNNNPEFSQESYTAAVSENLASGASLLTLEVTDKDEGGFSKGFFLHTSDTFDISEQGVVSLKNNVTLDREKTDRYDFEVVAVDQADGGLQSTAQVTITVLDYNDNAPQFPPIPDPLQIPEGIYSEEAPREIFAIVATDADLGANGNVTVSLSSPHPLFRFREDGMLLAVGSLDRETRETYELLVKATDGGSPQMEDITFIRVSLIDVNDNRPEFGSSSYIVNFLLKDAEEGKLLLMLSATDLDEGNNSLITYSFSAGSSPYLALNNETGAVTLTSNLSDISKDTTLQLTAMAKDHGIPPLNSTVPVVVNLRVASLVENVAFLSSSYNFSTPENQAEEAVVGTVIASSGSDLYNVTYKMKTHTDVFSVKDNGDIVMEGKLDKEQQEWYFLDVEAVDTRSPPTSAVTLVRVQVENVNEPPEFPDESYKASVFSITPYKTPVIQVKASDPDVGDNEKLTYKVLGDTSHFDVEPTSGLLYVVSVTGLNSEVKVEVEAKDPQGLVAKTLVKVEVEASGSSRDLVTITRNRLANVVEKKGSELERALGEVLGWTVHIVEVSGAIARNFKTRMTKETVKTLVSFFAVDGEEVVSAAEVIKKLQELSDDVQKKVEEVFGQETDFEVDIEPAGSSSNELVIFVLAVLLALSALGLIITVVLIISFKRREKRERDFQKKHFASDTRVTGFSNMALSSSATPEPKLPRPQLRSEDSLDRMGRIS
ncbi:unnamed protein product [Ophioblennius macclurei]